MATTFPPIQNQSSSTISPAFGILPTIADIDNNNLDQQLGSITYNFFTSSSPSSTSIQPAAMSPSPNISTISSSVPSAPQPDWANTLCTVFFALGVPFHPCVLLTSLFNLAVLFRSRLLHPNLRWILMAQSASIAFYQLTHCADDGTKITRWNPFVSSDKSIKISMSVAEAMIGVIGHLLLAERVIATVLVKRYEKIRKPYFAGIALPILFGYSVGSYFTYASSSSSSAVGFATNVLSTAFGFAEILAFASLGAYNRKLYKNIWGSPSPSVDAMAKQQKAQGIGGHETRKDTNGQKHLTEKYQISENIRTNRQLAPTFLFHFINLFLSCEMSAVAFFNFPPARGWQSYSVLSLSGTFYTLFNWAIEITVITHHPMLKKKALKWLPKGLLHRVLSGLSPASVAPSERGQDMRRKNIRKSVIGRTADGEALYTGNGINEHFEMLQQAWA